MDFYFLLVVIVVIKCTDSQYLTVSENSQRKPGVTSTCEQTSTKSALVEHFFNIIFTEFHNNPPVCVCVQMCPDQPTYCYPNGCLKKDEKKKPEVPLPMPKFSENTKPIFLVNEKTDFMNDFLLKNYIDESKAAGTQTPLPAENLMAANLRPDPFKDRYKILFKYKKMPKVELKYNLGEQVKNMKSDVLKSDSLDVSKTRWPMNKIDRRLGTQKIYNEARVHKVHPSYFLTVYPEKDPSNYPPKYFKRELPNNTNTEEVDVKAIYVVGKPETDNSAFSIEKLIDSLIESSFDNTSTTLNVDGEANDEPNLNTPETTTAEYNGPKNNLTEHNETTNIISMNFTNETVDKNKYTDDFINNTNRTTTFSEMIASLSKRIDIQNNTSLEMMRRITGVVEVDAVNATIEKPIEPTDIVLTEASTKETTVSHIENSETKTTRKGRQRIVRRHNSKYN